MVLINVRKKSILRAALATVFVLAVSGLSGAAEPNTTAPNVTITASGTFATPPLSGADSLKLAGQPFSISIVANAASMPVKHGPNWGIFYPFKMTGTVHSGILPTPVNIASAAASIYQLVGPDFDDFATAFPVRVIGLNLKIQAEIVMPPNTIPKFFIHPFAAVALTPGNATMTYSNGTETTALAIDTGTLIGKLPNGQTTGAPPPVALHANGAQVITARADGSRSERSMSAGPVTLAASNDQVALKFYASGVRDASNVQVRIGGEEATVLYAGKSGYFGGLDEVIIQVPRSLAGRGAVDVLLSADSQTAPAVQVEIQ